MKWILFSSLVLLASCSSVPKREPQSVGTSEGAKFTDCRLIVRTLDGKFLGMAPFEAVPLNEGYSYVATVRGYASTRILHNNGLEMSFVYLDDASSGYSRGTDRGFFAVRMRNLSAPATALRIISDRSYEDFDPGVRWNEDSIVNWAVDSIGRIKGPMRATGTSKRFPTEAYLKTLEPGILNLVDFDNEWIATAVCGPST